MSFLQNTRGWPSLFAVLALCVLLGFVSGCGGAKKAEFEPGGDWVEDMRDGIKENIKEPDRKTEMLAIVDQMEKDLQEMDRVVQKFYADLEPLNDNYNANPEEFQKVIAEFETSRKKVGDRIVDNWFKLRDLSTPEEWKKITHKAGSLHQQMFRQPDE